MSYIDCEITLTIDRLAGLGEGSGTWEGHKVFVPHTLAGERVRAIVTQDTKEFLRARLIEIEEASEDRKEAFCPHFTVCGGCTLQHLTPAHYLKFKQQMLQEALRKSGFEQVKPEIMLELGIGQRRRVDWTVSEKNGELSLGFQAGKSHSTVDINECRVLIPQLQQLIHPLRAVIKKLGLGKRIESVQALYLGGLLDVGIVPKGGFDPALETSFLALGNALGAARVSIYRSEGLGPLVLLEKRAITRKTDAVTLDIPPFSFLQASELAEHRMIQEAMQGLKGCKKIADLFCGMGTFTFPLSIHAKVTGYESVRWMTDSLQQTVKRHAIGEGIAFTHRNLFTRPLKAVELNHFDGVIINPPREGAKEQCAQIAQSNIKKLVMISCNPASFARDARTLREGGYEMTRVLGIDQFAFSSHLEIVAHFVKK